ncbi:MAG TPA: PVC-type heme-binding CxxCH protein, partial [Anseongella sp.]|nr:PVC-type heme-binding CxxCH protein [Anseongella sp.]
GTHGVFTHSKVGKPGTPDDERTGLNAGVWRYHPLRHEFEVFAHGTSNPWGIDFNDVGHAFTTVCVIPHLYHVIQGARYLRQGGKHFNPYTYDDIETIADHVHWLGDSGPHADNFRSAGAGGGHAHAGAMFYLGNKHWGLDRNSIFLNNLHGHRVNEDRITRSGSGYTAAHGKDFILTNDSWSLWLNFQVDPSGSVYVNDWYDQNQCHNPNPDVHNKTLGRIYKISHRDDKWVSVDLSKKTDLELVELQLHENDWYVRHARRLLQERKAGKEAQAALWKILNDNPDVTRKLRALWALHVTNGISEEQFLELLNHKDEYIRSWAIQLIAEDNKVSAGALERFTAMAKSDESALVRLYLASAVQRMDPAQTWNILQNLCAHKEDAGDHNL